MAVRKALYLTLLYCFATCSLFAKIVEAEHFSDIISHTTENTLVILDIDDTILIPAQTLGTDVWFCHRLKHHQEVNPSVALEKALGEWEAVRHITCIKIVEEGTEKIIEELQRNHLVMGLTTQGLALADRTTHQLNSLHVDLSKTAPSKQDHYLVNNEEGVLFRKGILFTAGTPKGEALLKLLDAIDYRPARIVFINDKAEHLRDVESSVIAKGIDFVGLRYSYGDQRVAGFRPEIAEIQWEYSTFAHLLSDEEAEEILRKKQDGQDGFKDFHAFDNIQVVSHPSGDLFSYVAGSRFF